MAQELDADLEKVESEAPVEPAKKLSVLDLIRAKQAGAAAPPGAPPKPPSKPAPPPIAEPEEEEEVEAGPAPRPEAPEPIQGDEARLLRSIEELKQLTSNPSMPVEVSKEEWALLSNQENEALIDMIRRKMHELGPEEGKIAAAEELVEQINHSKRLIAVTRIVWHTQQRTLGALLQELSEVQAKEIVKTLKPSTRPKPAVAPGGEVKRATRVKLSDDEIAVRTLMKYGLSEEKARARVAAGKAEEEKDK